MDNTDKADILKNYFGYIPEESETKIHYDWLLTNMWHRVCMIENENNEHKGN